MLAADTLGTNSTTIFIIDRVSLDEIPHLRRHTQLTMDTGLTSVFVCDFFIS